MILTTVSRQTRETIDRVLRANLTPWHYEGFEAESRLDSTGDPAIFITVRFEPAGELPPVPETSRTTLQLFDSLQEEGDSRIPYLDYHYPDEPESDQAV